ncbi:MAG: cyclic pyranopterin monophosphate synthase MoaC [Candidatus Aminicenantes bacterium]|nr:cyclic pyranopterin monophosphate synthase MoaC [Candidatus Aminicenantes bacterium]
MHMIDISDKEATKRRAVAKGKLHLQLDTINKINKNEIKKGDPIDIARIAAIYAAKETSRLIPLCHQIPLELVECEFDINEDSIDVKVTVSAFAKTGVEMEALAGVSLALLTLWDMVKYLEKDAAGQYPLTRITDVEVLKKEK